MQDYNYLHTNCFEITVELSMVKNPRESTLSTEWNNNKNALLEYMKWVHKGVKGTVTDADGKPIPGASISVFDNVANKQIDHIVRSNAPFGDYYRILIPGTYSVTVSASGYQSATSRVTVTSGNAAILDFTLSSN